MYTGGISIRVILEVVSILLEAGADPSARKPGYTPIDLAKSKVSPPYSFSLLKAWMGWDGMYV
eukprot:1104667-Amorphochlora_amoeboformis.AAC.1